MIFMRFYSFPYLFQVCKTFKISIFCGNPVQQIKADSVGVVNMYRTYSTMSEDDEEDKKYIQAKHFPFSLMITTTHIHSA